MLLPAVFNDNVFDDLMDDFDDVFSVRETRQKYDEDRCTGCG